jgi:hypothetical protein
MLGARKIKAYIASIPKPLIDLIFGLIAVLLLKNLFYTVSSDLALHYDLARSIAKTWRWPETRPLASLMHTYPPLAHYLGAIAGIPFQSTLIGLNIVSIVSVFGCYLLLARAVALGTIEGAAAALGVVALGLVAARSQFAVEGFEVWLNFFYAQMVGEFAFLLFVYWMCSTRFDWKATLALTVVSVFVGGWLYLLASVLIALAYLVLETFKLARRMLGEKAFSPLWAVPLLAGLVVLPLTIYFHPEYGRMAAIAGNNGALDLRRLQHMTPVFAVALLVVSIGLGVLARDSERWRNGSLFLATAGGATATGALLQTFAYFVLHLGSDYAIRKYSYGVFTLLIVGVAAVLATFVDSKVPRRSWRIAGLLAAPAFALIATAGLPVAKPARLDKVAKYQKYVQRTMAAKTTPGDAFGFTVSRNRDFAWHLNHVVTMVDLGMDPNTSLVEDAPGAHPLATEKANYAFMDDPLKLVPASCVIPSAPSFNMILVKLKCAELSTIGSDAVVAVAGSSVLPRYFGDGWGWIEPNGVWSISDSATLAMHFRNAPDEVTLTCQCGGFVPTPTYVQRVPIRVGGTPVGEWRFNANDPVDVSREVRVPGELIKNGDLVLTFDFPNAGSMAAYKLNEDSRRLALHMTTFMIKTIIPLRPGDKVAVPDLAPATADFVSGWSGREPNGIWSTEREASLVLTIADVPPTFNLLIDGIAFIPDSNSVQHVAVSAGGVLLGNWTLDAKTPGPLTLSVPRTLVQNGKLKLDFSLPDTTSPAGHGLSADVRPLGFFVKSIAVEK